MNIEQLVEIKELNVVSTPDVANINKLLDSKNSEELAVISDTIVNGVNDDKFFDAAELGMLDEKEELYVAIQVEDTYAKSINSKVWVSAEEFFDFGATKKQPHWVQKKITVTLANHYGVKMGSFDWSAYARNKDMVDIMVRGFFDCQRLDSLVTFKATEGLTQAEHLQYIQVLLLAVVGLQKVLSASNKERNQKLMDIFSKMKVK